MSPLKPTSNESEYFARQEALKLRKLVLKQREELNVAERTRLKELHWMCCPKCGLNLRTVTINKVEVDKCFACGGMFLDDGELEKIALRSADFFKEVREIFKEE